MSNYKTFFKEKIAGLKLKTNQCKAIVAADAAIVTCSAARLVTFCVEGSGSTGIAINFDTSQMFTFANTIIEALMPVVYITAGLGLGFMIINSLRNAFSGR